MKDDELLERLLSVPADGNGIEDVCGYAADRIQELMLDVAGWISNAQAAHDYQCEAKCKLEAAEAKLAKTADALVKAKIYIEELEWLYAGPRIPEGDEYYTALAELEKSE